MATPVAGGADAAQRAPIGNELLGPSISTGTGFHTDL
jgi:hypothetical protein